jgi:hypothetical protein
MALRRIAAGILAMTMISPAWGVGQPLGSVTSSINATVRDTKLTSGSTVFNGDTIAVGEHGGARISLTGGAQAEVVGDSVIRLTKAEKQIQMIVDRGQASFLASTDSTISARVADATVRPAANVETAAVIQSLSETHAIVAAKKGALLITTAHDGKVYTVPEGEAADLSAMVADSSTTDSQTPAAPAGKAAPPAHVNHKKAVIWTVVIVGAGVAVASYLLIRNETKLSSTQIGNEISPAKVN